MNGILRCLWLVDSSNSFSWLIKSIFIFSQYFSNRFSPVEKCWVTPHCLYHDSLFLIDHISCNRRRAIAASLSICIEVSVLSNSVSPLQEALHQLIRQLQEKLPYCNSSKTKIHMNPYDMVIYTLKKLNYCWYFDVFILFSFIGLKGQKQSFKIWYDAFSLLWSKRHPLLSAAL